MTSIKDQIVKAACFASIAHADVDHFRKYTKEPYIVHPEEVASILFHHECEPITLVVAYLHDTLEDTKVTYDDLVSVFGRTVADHVVEVSDVPGVVGKRPERMAVQREHYAAGSAVAHDVKIADMISNIKSICEYDPSFGRVYLREKRELLSVLTKGKKSLQAHAWKEIAYYTRMLQYDSRAETVRVMPSRAEILDDSLSSFSDDSGIGV